MKKVYIPGYCLLLGFCFWVGCSGAGLTGTEPADEAVKPIEDLLVRIAPEGYIDSAQVFFFKILENTDTLIRREVIYDIKSEKTNLFHFELPASRYKVYIFGNIGNDVIVARAPYSEEDIYFDYSNGRQPPHVYYGSFAINAGKDTTALAGLTILTSSVQLTIRDVPEEVSGIVVRLLNTAAGLTLRNGYIMKPTDPPLSDTLSGVKSDSTYVSQFSCFPGVGTNAKSILDVTCYDANGKIIYSGQSQPFEARPGYHWEVACSFAVPALYTKMDEKRKQMYFSINRK